MNVVRKLIKESSYTIISQLVSLLSGIVLSFVLPKYISVENFGYWQLFILLASYTGICLLGFGDGIFLIIGGESFSKLNRRRWYPQVCISSFLQIFIAIIILFCSCFFYQEDNIKHQILYILSYYVIIENIFKVLAFILMATDRIIRYSKLVMLDKLIISISVILLLIIGDIDVIHIIILYTLSHTVIMLICIKSDFSDLFNYIRQINLTSIINYIHTIQLGFILTLSNIIGMFIVGSGRFIIEHYWDIETFSKVSLALTISSFLLFFVSQISYVLYPFLRNTNDGRQKLILEKGSTSLTIISIISFSLFFPLYYIVKNWLPDYNSSLSYFIILAPLSLFEIKNNLLYITYFKNLCKVRSLLAVNSLTVLLALCLYFVFATVRNIDALVISMLIAIAFRCSAMQFILYRYYSLQIHPKYYWEYIVITLFIFSYFLLGIKWLIPIYALLIIFTLIVFYKDIYYFKTKLPKLWRKL